MTKKALIVGFVAMLSLSTFAQTASTKIKDARTKPDLYFLRMVNRPVRSTCYHLLHS